jgi:uncharacterized protein
MMQYGMNPFGNRGYPYPVQNNKRYKNENRYNITVNGKGSVVVKPDQAKITIGIVTENQQLLEAQQENTIVSNRIIKTVRHMGIEETSIQTTLYNIQPQYDFIDGKSVFKGYQVDHQLEIAVKDITRLGAILDTSFKNGANRGGNIRFFVSTPEAYYLQAIKKAVHNAQEKAEVIAQTVGSAINTIPVKVTEKDLSPPERFPVLSYKMATEAAQGTPPIQKGEFTIEALVTAVFEYRQEN